MCRCKCRTSPAEKKAKLLAFYVISNYIESIREAPFSMCLCVCLLCTAHGCVTSVDNSLGLGYTVYMQWKTSSRSLFTTSRSLTRLYMLWLGIIVRCYMLYQILYSLDRRTWSVVVLVGPKMKINMYIFCLLIYMHTVGCLILDAVSRKAHSHPPSHPHSCQCYTYTYCQTPKC